MNGKTLRNLRLYHGLTQESLSNVIGVSRAYLSLIEHGKKPVSDRVKMKVAQHFKVTDELIQAMENVEKLF